MLHSNNNTLSKAEILQFLPSSTMNSFNYRKQDENIVPCITASSKNDTEMKYRLAGSIPAFLATYQLSDVMICCTRSASLSSTHNPYLTGA